jgi:hypothetical protein
MSSRYCLQGIAAVLLPLACASALRASVVVLSMPSDDSYLSSTSLLAVVAPDFSNLSSFSLVGSTVSLSSSVQIRTVPDTWATWNAPPFTETETPRVLFSNVSNSLALEFTEPYSIFGFEAEPESLAVSTITANFFEGGTLLGSISLPVDGSGGALLFAATTDAAFTRVTVQDLADSGFAIAEVRAASVPEPSTLLLFGALLLAFGAVGRRRAGKALEENHLATRSVRRPRS